MKTSPAGLAAITQREGLRLQAYPDVRGIPTIGVGHTGPEVHLGLIWTQAQAQEALMKDIAWAENEVNTHVTVPLTANQFDALVSFTFNVGKSGFDHSSALRDFNYGVTKAANDLLMWEQPPVLKARRESERAQFLTRSPA
jgi:lysozyme